MPPHNVWSCFFVKAYTPTPVIWGLKVVLILQRRKVWPGLTTILASCRRPMSDSSSFLLQNGLAFRKSFMYHLWIVDWRHSSLSAGRRSSSLMVSSSILDMLRGLHAWEERVADWGCGMHVLVNKVRLNKHSCSVAAAVRKLSRKWSNGQGMIHPLSYMWESI